jgi:hypothetical protein
MLAESSDMIDANTLPVDEDGVPYVHLERISRVGLADLATVAEYRIEEHFGSISHHVRLCNGGKLRFAYALSGELLELSGEQLLISITPEGVCMVGPYRPPEI